MKVVLKKGREKSVKNGHPWIFSGAIESMPPSLEGDLQEVYSSQNEFLGWGYFNSKSKILGRMISYKNDDPVEEIKKKIKDSFQKRCFGKETNAFRAING
ncbi:MAG: class I SAM-dependent rRNA methyltransferase, partial [Parachlamydiaceae bacterium]